MASASTLNDRILLAVASCRVQSDVPAEVLKAIGETHDVIERGTCPCRPHCDCRDDLCLSGLEPIRGAGEGA